MLHESEPRFFLKTVIQMKCFSLNHLLYHLEKKMKSYYMLEMSIDNIKKNTERYI